MRPLMQDLTLKPGPVLLARRWETDDEHENGRWHEENVTDRAHERLFDIVTLDAAVTLGDIFRLLDAGPLLRQIFRRDFADELCAEARKGAVAENAPDPSSPESIEYLELYQVWLLDTSTSVYTSTRRLQLHGVGCELTRDAPDYGRSKCERIHWSVSLTPLRELLSLPLRVNPEVRLMEDDINAKAFGDEVARGRHPDVTLGQVIDGVVWELSFHGGPQERAEFRDELNQQVAAVKAGTATLVSGDDIFQKLDRPGCETMFDSLGGETPRDIGNALRKIDDDENAATWFDKTFGGAVVVKPQFRDRTGREFRKAFRAAAR